MRSEHPATTPASPARDLSAPLGTATRGQLTFARGVSLLTLGAAQAPGTLFQAHFEGPVPHVDAADGAVTIRYARLSLAEWARYALLWGQHASTIALAAALPWQITINGGATRLGADLRALRLSGLTIAGGVSEATLELAAPRGVVAIRVAGGANRLTLRLPARCAAQLVVRHSASQLAFDEQHYGAVGGTMRIASPGAAQAPDRYEVEVAGGANELAIDRW